jgi:hypothetical protein
VVLAGVATGAAAQTGFGLKGGFAFSKFSTTPDASEVLTQLRDLSGGIFIAATQQTPVTAMFEALLSRRGAEIVGPLGMVGSAGKLRGTYLDLSALVRAKAGGSAGRQAYIFAGATVGLELAAELVVAGVGENLNELTEDYDFGVTFGAGADINHFVIEGRYTHGLTELILAPELVGIQALHRSFSVMVGVRF